MLTAEYWKEIPWYVYILFIGLALISFAMFDEKRKQAKKQQLSQVNNVIPNQSMNLVEPVIPPQPVVEEPIPTPVEIPLPEEELAPEEVQPATEEVQPLVEEPVVEEKEEPKMTIQIVEDTSSEEEITKDQSTTRESKNNKKTNSSNKYKKTNNRR